jgi:hypothetical protein
MDKSVVMPQNKFIPEKAFLLPSLSFGQECLSVPVTAELAALFCTGRKTDLYSASAVESLSVQWKVGLHNNNLHFTLLEAVLCFSAIRF